MVNLFNYKGIDGVLVKGVRAGITPVNYNEFPRCKSGSSFTELTSQIGPWTLYFNSSDRVELRSETTNCITCYKIRATPNYINVGIGTGLKARV